MDSWSSSTLLSGAVLEQSAAMQTRRSQQQCRPGKQECVSRCTPSTPPTCGNDQRWQIPPICLRTCCATTQTAADRLDCCLQTLAYLLPALTLALKRAEAAYRRRQAAVSASRSSSGRVSIKEEDLWTVQVCACHATATAAVASASAAAAAGAIAAAASASAV